MSETVFIPFSKELYDDLVRFSDGRIDPAWLAESRVRMWIEIGLMVDDPNNIEDYIYEPFEERIFDLAEKYAPDSFRRWQEIGIDQAARSRPLIWKGLVVPAGSEVRMSYKGEQHFAHIEHAAIVDNDGAFSPSEWASKVADGTSRNAWRDLSFKMPDSAHWVQADILREKFLDTLRTAP